MIQETHLLTNLTNELAVSADEILKLCSANQQFADLYTELDKVSREVRRMHASSEAAEYLANLEKSQNYLKEKLVGFLR